MILRAEAAPRWIPRGEKQSSAVAKSFSSWVSWRTFALDSGAAAAAARAAASASFFSRWRFDRRERPASPSVAPREADLRFRAAEPERRRPPVGAVRVAESGAVEASVMAMSSSLGGEGLEPADSGAGVGVSGVLSRERSSPSNVGMVSVREVEALVGSEPSEVICERRARPAASQVRCGMWIVCFRSEIASRTSCCFFSASGGGSGSQG